MPSVVVSEPLISSISTHGPLEAGRGGTARREGQGAVSRRKGEGQHAESEGDRRKRSCKDIPFSTLNRFAVSSKPTSPWV